MNKKILIVEGYLASGKSTFALRLSQKLKVPYLIKDTFKTALCKSVTIADRQESSRFSGITFDAMMYVAERMLEAGYPLVIEGNFVPAGIKKTDESEIIRQLIKRYAYRSLDFKFVGDTRVLHQRFIEREKTPERGQANVIGEEVPLGVFDTWCHNLDGFHVGGRSVRVDTTDFNHVDFQGLLETAHQFMNE
ncbi:MAG: ATP-binding protein [Provencibacterium sp.]|jgi:predicted kinase|nr:ATP-binding protein [Provencibacterium sp.]